MAIRRIPATIHGMTTTIEGPAIHSYAEVLVRVPLRNVGSGQIQGVEIVVEDPCGKPPLSKYPTPTIIESFDDLYGSAHAPHRGGIRT